MGKTGEKTSKHERVLEIHSRLMSGEIVRKQELADKYGVNERSIQRDIDSIREFYSNRAVNGEGVTEVRYDRAAGGFRIVSEKMVTLTNAELFSVAKIMLESRSLKKEEMTKIIEDLVNACLPIGERRKMRDLLGNELFHYVEPRHGKRLVDMVWELGSAVYAHKKIAMEYRKANGEVTSAEIKPVGIIGSEYYFYLIGYVGDKDQRYPGYPTIYRIDRIIGYKILKEHFQIPYANRFEEGEFRKRIPFMYGGPLTKVEFVYSGSDINAVLDRLPASTVEVLEDGSYKVKTEVYGKIGIDMWLNGQGDVRR